MFDRIRTELLRGRNGRDNGMSYDVQVIHIVGGLPENMVRVAPPKTYPPVKKSAARSLDMLLSQTPFSTFRLHGNGRGEGEDEETGFPWGTSDGGSLEGLV